jgi:hypothetical protein
MAKAGLRKARGNRDGTEGVIELGESWRREQCRVERPDACQRTRRRRSSSRQVTSRRHRATAHVRGESAKSSAEARTRGQEDRRTGGQADRRISAREARSVEWRRGIAGTSVQLRQRGYRRPLTVTVIPLPPPPPPPPLTTTTTTIPRRSTPFTPPSPDVHIPLTCVGWQSDAGVGRCGVGYEYK